MKYQSHDKTQEYFILKSICLQKNHNVLFISKAFREQNIVLHNNSSCLILVLNSLQFSVDRMANGKEIHHSLHL